jgi:hypothetical protein
MMKIINPLPLLLVLVSVLGLCSGCADESDQRIGDIVIPRISNSVSFPCQNTTGKCFDHLLWAITHDFPNLEPTTSTVAHPGRDWCRETERDQTTNWWYLWYPKDNTAHSADEAIRIKATVNTSSGRFVDFGSIFLALDLLKTNDYGGAKHKPFVRSAANLMPVDFPHPWQTDCPSLHHFLRHDAFPNYVANWEVVDDPACAAQGNCGMTDIVNNGSCDPSVPNPNCVDNVQIDTWTNEQRPEYWRFNNITHTISGDMRFLIIFTAPSGQYAPYAGKYAFLWVGYGGAGGGV